MGTDQPPPWGSPDSEHGNSAAPAKRLRAGNPIVVRRLAVALNNPIVVRLLAVICLLVAAFFLVPGLKALVDDWRFINKAASADGVVTGLAPVAENVSRQYHEGDVIFYHPVIRFVTAHGREVTFQATQGSENRPAQQLGQSVRILYDPENPTDARLDTWYSRWGPVDNLLFGFYFLLPAILGFLGPRLFALIATRISRRRT
jgi:hypothetical protein